MALSPLDEKAAHDPSARPGLIATPATVTLRSFRGMANLNAPSGCIFPLRPNADSTGFHSGGLCSADCATATQGTNANRTKLRNRVAYIRCIAIGPPNLFSNEVE